MVIPITAFAVMKGSTGGLLPGSVGSTIQAWSNTLDQVTAGTYTGSSSITTLGTIASGLWHGTTLGSTYGGTGVNNGSNTLTLGNNLITSGNFPLTLTQTGTTNITLPTTGTLITSSVLSLPSLATVGTITSGTWNGTALTGTYGGTGVNNGSSTITLGGNLTTSGANAVTLTTTGPTSITLPTSGTIITQAPQTLSFQPGLLSTVVNTIGGFNKIVKAPTVDNIEASALTFNTCSPNPTITMYNCGASTTCSGPTTIGTVTITTSGTVVNGSVSNSAIAAGDYIAWAITAGTCVALNLAATAQIHSN